VKAFATCFVGSCLKQLRIVERKYAKVIRARSTKVRGCGGRREFWLIAKERFLIFYF
jgi:hypothetical protein